MKQQDSHLFHAINSTIDEVNKVVVGKNTEVRKVMMAILAKGHVLLDDVPGVGKTTLALSFSKALGLDFQRVQFTPDTMPSDIIGFSVYNKDTGALDFKPGAVMTNFLLADEINRTSAKTQAALLQSMEESQVSVDGVTHELPTPFVVIATQNPVGSAGTMSLPNSQLDRFIIRMSMGYPDKQSQIAIMADRATRNPLDSVQQRISKEVLQQAVSACSRVTFGDEMYGYVQDLIDATRNHELVELGVSPRGALALCRAAKAWAFLNERDFVTPDDVHSTFAGVCAHRLMLGAKAKLHEHSDVSVAEEILASVPRPDVARVGL